MKSQIDSTVARLDYLGNKAPPSIDAEIQWARWCGLLRFYANRSAAHGLLPVGDLDKIMSGISRIETTMEAPARILKTGIVVNIPAGQKMPSKHADMRLIQLTSVEFEETILQSEYSSFTQRALPTPAD
jgi:hypothetical protein